MTNERLLAGPWSSELRCNRKTVLDLDIIREARRIHLAPWVKTPPAGEDWVAYHFRRQYGHGVQVCPEKRKSASRLHERLGPRSAKAAARFVGPLAGRLIFPPP